MANTTICPNKGSSSIKCDGCGAMQVISYAEGKESADYGIKNFERRHSKCKVNKK